MQCKNPRCIKLAKEWRTTFQDDITNQERRERWQLRKAAECKKCQHERDRRWRVTYGEEEQHEQEKFAKAPCIVANNDVKYEVNKRRAQVFAFNTKRQKGKGKGHGMQQSLFWCAAKDTVTTEALRDDPTLPQKKMEWLQRHDRESGDLYGICFWTKYGNKTSFATLVVTTVCVQLDSCFRARSTVQHSATLLP